MPGRSADMIESRTDWKDDARKLRIEILAPSISALNWICIATITI